MTVNADHPAGTIAADQATHDHAASPQHALAPVADAPPLDRSVYLEAARALLPRWVHLIGAAPWLSAATQPARRARTSASALHRQQAATLGVALLTNLDDQRPDDAYLRECVRTSLIFWQLCLRSDGQPVDRKSSRSPLHAAICASVVQLLSETIGFQTTGLLQDLSQHIRWLARRPQATSYLEAAAICAMADGALLCREPSLLARGRHRLLALVKRQSPEGWFPERGGADIGRLSLTVDWLSRVYQLYRWEELTEPLQKALRFLLHFVHPDGVSGGCYGSCETGFLSPYGVELLSPTFPDARKLAYVCRRRFERFRMHQPCGWHDDLSAVLGASAALAAANAPATLNIPAGFPYEEIGGTHFPQAGLSIFSTKAYHAVVNGRKGGSLHVTWRSGSPCLDDPGISVATHHRMRTSNRFDIRARHHTTRWSVTSSGILRATDQSLSRRGQRIARLLRRLAAPLAPTPRRALRRLAHRFDPSRLMRDRYRRDITLGEDWVRIRDSIRCRLPCRTIVCQSPPPGRAATLVDAGDTNRIARPPIFVEGGRRVEITRVYRDGKLI